MYLKTRRSGTPRRARPALQLEVLEHRITPAAPPPTFIDAYKGSEYPVGSTMMPGVYRPVAAYVVPQTGKLRQASLEPFVARTEPSASFLTTLNAWKTRENDKDKDAPIKWVVETSNVLPTGAFFKINTYAAYAGSTVTMDGTRVGATGLYLDITSDLKSPEKTGLAPADKYQWIQVYTTNDIGGLNLLPAPSSVLDIKDGQTTPFYPSTEDRPAGAQAQFPDTPQRIRQDEDISWKAETFLVRYSTATGNKVITILPVGMTYGWTTSARTNYQPITLEVSSSAAQVRGGNVITFTATPTSTEAMATPPTGNVAFFDATRGEWLGPPVPLVTFNDETSAMKTSPMPAGKGPHTIVAYYDGDATYGGDVGYLTQAVVANNASIRLDTSVATAAAGQAVTLTAHVEDTDAVGIVPTGTVSFYAGATFLGSAAVSASDGSASLTVSTLPVGVNYVTAVYSGDDVFDAATSDAATLTVTEPQPGVTVVLTSGASTTGAWELVVFTAAVNGVGPYVPENARVEFFADGVLLGTVYLEGGNVAAFEWSFDTAGTYTITAAYSDDDVFTQAVFSLELDIEVN